MNISDVELENEVKKFLKEYKDNYLYININYIESETFYIEFINFLVNRGLKTIKSN